MHGRVRVAASLCFVLAAQARKLSLSASLGWEKEAQNATHGTATAMQLSLKPLAILFVSVAALSCRGTWPIELVAKLGLRSP